jgi:pimeloyl-ACP methyl ester carboxylesterase
MDSFVEVPGGRIFTVAEGDGLPIILIHAAIVDLGAWDAMVPGLTTQGFRVIRYDLRGFGRTETSDVEYSPRADLIAVMDAHGIRRAAVVGNSMGGQAALEAAIEYPDRFAAVVTLGSSPGGFEGGATPQDIQLFGRAQALQSASPRDPDALADLLVQIWADGPGQPPTRLPSAMREFVRERARKQFLPGYVSGRRIDLEPAANGRLGELRCPVLAVAGGLDISHEVNAARRVAEAAPNARAVIWPDVAHLIGMEQPERLNALASEFLAPLAPWS